MRRVFRGAVPGGSVSGRLFWRAVCGAAVLGERFEVVPGAGEAVSGRVFQGGCLGGAVRGGGGPVSGRAFRGCSGPCRCPGAGRSGAERRGRAGAAPAGGSRCLPPPVPDRGGAVLRDGPRGDSPAPEPAGPFAGRAAVRAGSGAGSRGVGGGGTGRGVPQKRGAARPWRGPGRRYRGGTRGPGQDGAPG